MYIENDRVLDSIIEQLINLSKFVLLKNSVGKYDINVECENLFCDLLNLIFNWNLVNLNQLQCNYPAIDLADINRRICIQVTSENTKRKVSETIEKFKEKKLDKKYKRLYFLIISDKNKPKNFKVDNFEVHVLDIKDLLNYISKVNNKNYLDDINNFLNDNLKSSAKQNTSILPIPKVIDQISHDYRGFIDSLGLNLNDDGDREHKDYIVESLNELHSILSKLTQPEREFLYFVTSRGTQPNIGSGYLNDTIFLPLSTLELTFGVEQTRSLFDSLNFNNLINYIDDYQPYYDSPYMKSFEVAFYGSCETNLFLSIKNYLDDESALADIIINCNFQLLC